MITGYCRNTDTQLDKNKISFAYVAMKELNVALLNSLILSALSILITVGTSIHSIQILHLSFLQAHSATLVQANIVAKHHRLLCLSALNSVKHPTGINVNIIAT